MATTTDETLGSTSETRSALAVWNMSHPQVDQVDVLGMPSDDTSLKLHSFSGVNIQKLNITTDSYPNNLNIIEDNYTQMMNITDGDFLQKLNITDGNFLQVLNITDGDFLQVRSNSTDNYLHNMNIATGDGLKKLPIDTDDYLKKMNSEFADQVLPAVVVLVVLMVLGAVGNMFVLLVYSRRSKRGTISRFIQALAVFDLLSCCLAIPGEIVDMTNNYTFGGHQLCKVIRTVNLFCTVASGATLVVVAIDRYKRICCPMRRQISPRGAVVILSCCALASMLVSLPTVVIYGAKTVTTDEPLVNGTDCSISDRFAGTLVPLAYNSLQMLLFLVGAIALVILYSLVGSAVCTHARQQQLRRRHLGAFSHGRVSMLSSCSTNMDNHCRVGSNPCTPTTKEATDIKLNKHGSMQVADFSISAAASKSATCQGCRHDTDTVMSNSLVSDQCKHKIADLTKSRTEYEDNCFYCSCRENRTMRLTISTLGSEYVEAAVTDSLQTNNSLDVMIGTRLENYQVAPRVDAPLADAPRVDAPLADAPRVDAPYLKNPESGTRMTPPCVIDLKVGSVLGVNQETRTSISRGVMSGMAIDVSCGVMSGTAIDVSRGVMPGTAIDVSCGVMSGTATDVSRGLVVEPKINAKQEESSEAGMNAPETTSSDERQTIIVTEITTSDATLAMTCRTGAETDSSRVDSSETETHTDSHTDKDSSQHQQVATRTSETHIQNNNTLQDLLKQYADSESKDSCGSKHQLTSDFMDENSEMTRTYSMTGADSNTNKHRQCRRRNNKERQQTSATKRTTMMLLLITVVYILSFLPHLVLMAIKALSADSLRGLGASWELVENLLIRSYFINSMINPIVYSFFSKHFLRDCRKSLQCCQRQRVDQK